MMNPVRTILTLLKESHDINANSVNRRRAILIFLVPHNLDVPGPNGHHRGAAEPAQAETSD